jgi:predicted Ser/Thr protein kinase
MSCFDEKIKNLLLVLNYRRQQILRRTEKADKLKMMLKDQGYSEKATREILKWYGENS